MFRVLTDCKGLEVFKVEFKDGMLRTPSVSFTNLSTLQLSDLTNTSLQTLVHVQVEILLKIHIQIQIPYLAKKCNLNGIKK